MRGGAGITFNRGLTHRFEKVKRSLALADLQHVFNGTYNGFMRMKERNSSGKYFTFQHSHSFVHRMDANHENMKFNMKASQLR